MAATTRALRLSNIVHIANPSFGGLTSMIMDADGEELAVKYFPPTTSPITAIDFFLTAVGDLSTVNFAVRVESSTSDAPNASVLGAASAGFAGPATSNWTGAQSLASNTGALTLNTPVWLIIARTSGSSLSVALSAALSGASVGMLSNGERERVFASSSWTGVTATSSMCRVVVTHANGMFVGLPLTGAIGNPSGITDIFGTNRQGLKLKFGAQTKLLGVMIRATKTGSPNALVAELFENTTSKTTGTVAAAEVISNQALPIMFDSPQLLAADVDHYIILKQSSDGGTDAADYDLNGFPITSGYISAMFPDEVRFVSGTGDDPSALTESTTFIPQMWPLLDDPATDIDMSASGTGFVPMVME